MPQKILGFLDIGRCVDLFSFDLVPSNMVENGKVIGTTTLLALFVELCSVGHILFDVCFVTHVVCFFMPR